MSFSDLAGSNLSAQNRALAILFLKLVFLKMTWLFIASKIFGSFILNFCLAIFAPAKP